MRVFVKFTVILFIIYFTCQVWTDSGFCAPLAGSVEEKDYLMNKGKTGSVVDLSTGKPVSNAQIGIPSKDIYTNSDSNGRFSLNASFDGPAILSVKADGYKPFSLTVSSEQFDKPFTLGITKSSGKEIVIDTNLHHLGDDNFSDESANAGNFRLKSNGPAFSKKFFAGNAPQGYILKIGSIIGIDTALAGRLGQSRTTSYSSPTKVYINSKKVGELRINGDNQQIILSSGYIIPNGKNKIVIETGRNLFARNIDFDDMEFMNLSLELR
ncbi:MAG: carboxypeptidase-like regulatory domain-containing protein [Candidatus Gastranaerophilales bacterium]|nr:carboxypeptidase-like regulatory domain-containing protein [Candidatus Gastranaerophilales bacterium]